MKGVWVRRPPYPGVPTYAEIRDMREKVRNFVKSHTRPKDFTLDEIFAGIGEVRTGKRNQYGYVKNITSVMGGYGYKTSVRVGVGRVYLDREGEREFVDLD